MGSSARGCRWRWGRCLGFTEGVRARDHVDHHPGGGWVLAGGAVVGVAEAGQTVGPVGHGSDGVGAALVLGPGIGWAHGLGDRTQPGVEGLGVGGEQGRKHRGHPAAVVLPDVHRPAPRPGLGAVHRLRVDLGDERVHGLLRVATDMGSRVLSASANSSVEFVQGRGVDDQGAALHHDPDQLVGDQSLGEHRGDQWEPFVQCDGDEELVGRGAMGDALGGADVGGDGVPGVGAPQVPLIRPVGGTGGLEHGGHRRDPTGAGRGLHPRPRLHRTGTRGAGRGGPPMSRTCIRIYARRQGRAGIFAVDANLGMNSRTVHNSGAHDAKMSVPHAKR